MLITQELQKKKLDDHDFTLQKFQAKVSNYEELSKKLYEIDTERKILEARMI